MTQINLIKRGGKLVPSLPQDEEKLARVKAGQIIQVSFKKPRNAAHHRKFFALIRTIVEHTDFDNEEQVLHLFKIKLGHFEHVIEPTSGKTFLMPKSISFAQMDQGQFDKFYKEAVTVALTLLPGWTKENLDEALKEVEQFA